MRYKTSRRPNEGDRKSLLLCSSIAPRIWDLLIWLALVYLPRNHILLAHSSCVATEVILTLFGNRAFAFELEINNSLFRWDVGRQNGCGSLGSDVMVISQISLTRLGGELESSHGMQ